MKGGFCQKPGRRRKVLDISEIRKDENLYNGFIQEHKRFILASAYKATGHFVTENDDAYSVALIAFHEAVDSYEEDKGDFHAFASLVIKRRVLDHLKSEARFVKEVPVDPGAMDGDVENETPETALHLEVRKKESELADEYVGNRPGTGPMRDEIEAVTQVFRTYGFSFSDLKECSPKAEKTKKACAQAVITLLRNTELYEEMRSQKKLPIGEIRKRCRIPRKILERHRRFIIASTEIMKGEYPLLGEYLRYVRNLMET